MPIWTCFLVGALAALIDWSGVGPHAARDRIAAIGYLASALGWFDLIGLAGWESRMHSSAGHEARIIWSMIGVVPVGFWLGAMAPAIPVLGRLGQLSFRRGAAAQARGAQAASSARINGHLLVWNVAVAASIPLAMPTGAYHDLVVALAGAVTGSASAVAGAVGSWFGWS